MRTVPIAFLLAITLGCNPGALQDENGAPPECDPDAGDAGFCVDPAPEANDFDAGIVEDLGQQLRDDACPLLVARVCGAGDDGCADAPACVAAQVLDENDDVERCQSAYDDTARWPDCVPGPCSVLVQRVCGALSPPGTCEEAPGCAPARELLAEAGGDDADERRAAETSCNAALEDDVVFSTCE